MVPSPDHLPPGPLTYEDYVELPDDGKQYEILDGELFVSPAPVPRHQRVSRNLQWILEGHLRSRRSGELLNAPIDLILAQTTIAQPDLLFVRAGREAIVTERAVEGPPDLVVEILSPNTTRKDRTTKAMLYARYRVSHYWILDPAERIFEGYTLEDGYRLMVRAQGPEVVRAEPFPDLEIPLGEVWA